MFLNELLLSSVRKYPDKTAVRFGNTSLTYAVFYNRIRRLAAWLQSKGVKRQDRVAVIAHNSHRYLEIIFACSMTGAVSEHFNGKLAPNVIRQLLEESTASIVMISDLYLETAQYLKQHLSRPVIFVFMEGTAESYSASDAAACNYEKLLTNGERITPAAWNERDVALQLYTSGTTGKPKGVMLTAANLKTQVLVSAVEGRWSHDEIFLCVLPLYHTTCISVFQVLLVGGELIISLNCKPHEIAASLEKFQATRTTLVPHLIKSLMQEIETKSYKLDSLRVINYGAAPMTPELMARCRHNLSCEFHQAYGMTEMTASISVLLPEMHHDPSLLTTVGKPVIGAEIRIVDDEGKLMPTGGKGEIIVKSATMMKGYYNNPELTQAVVRDGWYYTGDIGFFDERGFLSLVSRKKDMIISGGENIYPQEVAHCIMSMGREIADVAVIGAPDSQLGESVIAAVVLRGERRITEKEIIDHCCRKLGQYVKPRRVFFFNKLPRNESGKIAKNDILSLINQKIEQE
ncbi:MAG: AMP-binding protein [Gracilibacteraceae bacterium]|jgi:acyl-CoA synthetase (AMP-forming)/AMP-acid ligase II|nr:AMP-binding protein [Gracilibacteraceae bacterium]